MHSSMGFSWACVTLLLITYGGLEGYGGEVFDATTVYDVKDFWINETSLHSGSRNSIPGLVQKRTNALGLNLYSNGRVYRSAHTNETAVSCDIGTSCDWDLTGWPGIYSYVDMTYDEHGERSQLFTVSNGFDLKFQEQHYLTYNNYKSFLVFTRNNGPFRSDSNSYVVMELFDGSERRSRLWYDCWYRSKSSGYYYDPYEPQKTYWDVTDRDGVRLYMYCNSKYENIFLIDINSTLRFEIDRNVRIYQHGVTNSLIDLTEKGLQMAYMSIHASSSLSLKPLIRQPYLKTSENGSVMVSPEFVPSSKKICLAIIVNCPTELKQNVLVISARDRNQAEHFLAKVSDLKTGWQVKHVQIRLDKKISSPWKLLVKKIVPVEIDLSRISTFDCGGVELISLPNALVESSNLRRLPAYTATPEMIRVKTVSSSAANQCLNGGALTTAGCACPPGFTGVTCQIGCGKNRFGQDCGGRCSFRSRGCEGYLLCTEFTGCQCASGYAGLNCNITCPSGNYGNGCSQSCGKCAAEEICDKYTGKCKACALGYLPPFCKTVFVYYARRPELVSEKHETITATFDLRQGVLGVGEPQMYQIQYREKDQEWILYTSKTIKRAEPENSESSMEDGPIKETIDGLKNGIVYEVRILLMDTSYNKYDGELILASEVLTQCDIPENYDYKINSASNQTDFTFIWTYELGNKYWCPLEEYEVSWMENYQWKTDITKEPVYFLSGFEPGMEITFRLRAKTSGGFAPFSKNISISTNYSGTGSVDNLRMTSSQSTSLDISWDPPADSDSRTLKYTITYTCVNQVACSPGCKDATEGQLTQEATSVTLSGLLPFTQYLVTVTPEDGPESQLYVGTSEVAPTEKPILSSQKPVRSNTSVTVYWNPVPVCSSFPQGYTYQLTKESDSLKMLASGFTKDTSVSFYNLTASTNYIVKVFINTVAGWNPDAFLAINVSTSATVPEAVRNLTVYKKGRSMLGLRWAEPRTLYGKLKSFTVQYSLGKEVISETVEPTPCTVWPQLYCHTLETLKSNRKYTVTVSAQNVDLAEDGSVASITALTKESAPLLPDSLRVLNSTSTSVGLQWRHPDLVNGVLRSFLVNVEESEKFDQDSCCQVYPLIEILVKEETQLYEVEVSGLHPASTYYMSVSAKTVSLGPSQSLVVYTRPPNMPLSSLPGPDLLNKLNIGLKPVDWVPQSHLSSLNESDIFSPLVRSHIVLATVNDTQVSSSSPSESGISDEQLTSLLKHEISGQFYFLCEFKEEELVTNSVWGETPQGFQLSSGVLYQLVTVQITDYNNVYNIDTQYSVPFSHP